jgi:Outer membrane protein beta-barrel domain
MKPQNLKTLIAALVATLATTQALAQGPATTRTSLETSARPRRASGLAIMPAFTIGATQLTNLNDFDNQAKAGTGVSLSAGVLAELGRGTFVVQSGLLYMHQATSADVDKQGYNGANLITSRMKYDLSADYLGVPLAVKARTRVGEGVRLVGRLGITPSFLLSKKESASGIVNGFSERKISTSDSSKEGVRTFNVFAVAGFGPEFAITKNQNMRVELGYERMLMPLLDQGTSKISTHSLNLMLAYAAGF